MIQIPLLSALSERVEEPDVGFRTRMLEIAATLSDVIAMGRGDPDFHTPIHIVEAAKEALDNNQHHYTHPRGMSALLEAIAEKLRSENGLDYSKEEIIVTAGVQEAIMLCMLAFIDRGNEVLLPSPRFTSYDAAIRMCGGVPVSVPTHESDDFSLMPNEIRARITEHTKVLVLITPNNPTGAVVPPAIVREIALMAREHDLIVLSDEIYEKLVFSNLEHLSIGCLPGMKERTITLNGFSKAYAMTGWRVGYMAGPEPFIRMVTEIKHTLSISTSTPAQYAALAALVGSQGAVEEMRQAYAERREYLMKALDEMGLSYGYPGGAFYIYVNVSHLGMPAPVFCESLLLEEQVMIFPGSMFGDARDEYIRISYLQPLERIAEAVERMKSFIKRKADTETLHIRS